MHTPFPFTAIVGQDQLKLALLLNAVDPKIGGILISGPRGTAKSTAARALAPLLPEGGRFVSLPIGTTEDRLIGSLNIETVLGEGKVDFAPGLLHTAHGGILYVDEVNLLPDHLVDVLLDVVSSGVNLVERDGVSHDHPCRFVLIGTMNPEEGQLRPQLLDRFGLHIDLSGRFSPPQKTRILKRRLAFDDDPLRMQQQFSNAEQALKNRCLKARSRLAAVRVDETLYDYISQITAEAHVDGLRADLVIFRAARAHAAWQGNPAMKQEDIDFVAPMALSHRRNPPQQERQTSGSRGFVPDTGMQPDRGENTSEETPWPRTTPEPDRFMENEAVTDKKKA